MRFKLKLDTSSVSDQITKLEHALHDSLLLKAAEAAGQVLVDAYKTAVPRKVKTGTYLDANQQLQHFQQLYLSIGKKAKLFQDKTGAWCVVGVEAAPHSANPVAPQGYWIEFGTEERFHKDGSSTGKVTAAHILETVINNNLDAAQEAACQVLRSGINNVFGN